MGLGILKKKRNKRTILDDIVIKDDCRIIFSELKEVISEFSGHILNRYEVEMKEFSERSGYFSCDFAPGKVEGNFTGLTFYYKGTEVIYILPWERNETRKTPVVFVETKDGFGFNKFYDYVKYRYAKDKFGK